VADPQPGSVSFWERIARSGAQTLMSVAIIIFCGVMAYLGRDMGKQFEVAFWAALVWLFGAGFLTVIKGK